MVKTFITKLPASVNNDALPVLGMVHIPFHKQSVPDVKDRSIFVRFNANVTAKIAGDGYFTDDSLSTNKGKTLDIPASTLTKITVSNDDGYLQFDKYKIVDLRTDNDDWKQLCTLRSFDLDLNQLKYSNISILYLNNTNVTGDISALSNTTNISMLNLANTNVTGSMSSLSKLTKLTTLDIVNDSISGVYDDFAPLTSLNFVNGYGTNVKINSGTLSKLPKGLQTITLPDVSSCTWNKGERTNGYIFGSNAVFPLSNVDDFLIDMATCNKSTNTSSAWTHVINIRGNRTSASDSALAKLQELGYTVTINS